MAVFRIDKMRDYTVMSNHHLRNTELSLKAKGLLSLMLSLPENWDYTTKGLAAICKDGTDSISSCIREPEKHVYSGKLRRDETKCPFEAKLAELGIKHRLIKPRTPWHNGKVERSHRMDQRYFYDWEYFRETEEANKKLAEHLKWTNNKPMRIFIGKSPMEKLTDYIWVI